MDAVTPAASSAFTTRGWSSAALVTFASTLMVLAIRERPVSRRPPEGVVVASAPGV